MKQLFLFLFVLLLSCSENKPKVLQQHNNVPQALAEQKSDASLFTKRSGNDLVQELYEELLKSDPSLITFENAVLELPAQKSDSLNYYQVFTAKNFQYYTSAETYLSQIKDSVLKNRIKALLAESRLKSENALSEHQKLIAEIDTKNNRLADLHYAIRIAVTLPVMEKYQKENNPSTAPIKAINNKYDALITKADSLFRK